MFAPDGPILIVDDNAETRTVLAHMLEIRGYATAEAGSGRAALEYFRGGRGARLIILDMMMPDLSGAEVRAALQKRSGTAAIPVIVYSAVDAAGRISDVTAYIRKAMDPERLLRVVDQVCGSDPSGRR